MVNIYIIADTHFGHEATWKVFKRLDGTPLRPFTSTVEMDEAMVERWNAKVRPQDHVYHLGDVVIAKPHLQTVAKLNGHKRLVRGNHDIYKTHEYIKAGFGEIYGCRVFADMILSHIPIHPDSLTKRFHCNVHGHLHIGDYPDPRYLCVSVEHTDYAPLHIDEVRERIKQKVARLESDGPYNG